MHKNAPPLGSHVFQANVTIFELIQDINKTNLLTIFHEDWTINVASRFLKKPKPFVNSSKISLEKNLLIKFYEDRQINVASRVLTRKNAPPPWRPYIIGMNLLTKFHKDWTINVASRVTNAPPLGSHVFEAMFHEDRKINVASRPYKEKCPVPWRPCFLTNRHHFRTCPDIIGINLLTKFHEDQTINVASRVKNARPLGCHVFQANITILELIQDIIETNLLTKFHEDWTINVASYRVNNAN
ncbi:hypothetical protein DPMN_179473 [Dreissena polymorpha]|uniref:Uncharacterized protein n=1 Tax=Dreissena polymorpha TaxID=45954 RepID=A0A9D4EH38_DREPO|nr:hypothetical protein DPMN_179473 [Dreissena polymorpha]